MYPSAGCDGPTRASGYRFHLIPIIGPCSSCNTLKNVDLHGRNVTRIADSPKFMTYMAWERSSLCACSMGWYSPLESTFKHCIQEIHKQDTLRWTQASYVDTGTAVERRENVGGVTLDGATGELDRGRTLTAGARRTARRGDAGAGAAGSRLLSDTAASSGCTKRLLARLRPRWRTM